MNGSNTALLAHATRGPVMLITLGILLAIDHLGVYSFWRTWPILLVVFGAFSLAERILARPVGGNA